jgi:hypothetical protein
MVYAQWGQVCHLHPVSHQLTVCLYHLQEKYKTPTGKNKECLFLEGTSPWLGRFQIMFCNNLMLVTGFQGNETIQMHITKEKTISNSLRKQTEPCGV